MNITYYTKPVTVYFRNGNDMKKGIAYKNEVIEVDSLSVYSLSEVTLVDANEYNLSTSDNTTSVITWHKVLPRDLTEEEINQYASIGVSEDWIPDYTFEAPMPKDGERILLRTDWGTDVDTCVIENDGVIDVYQLDESIFWEGVYAWAYLPE